MISNSPFLTAHSEYHRLRSVFLKSIDHGFRNQEQINAQWRSLNYLSAPDMTKACTEYKSFISFIQSYGTEIHQFSVNNDTGMDSIYCRDASIATDHGIILCHMGKAQRQGEPKAQGDDFIKKGMKILGTIEPPGTLEGGDVAWIDPQTLAVAHGYRTNDEGFNQLHALLSPHNVDVIQVPLPHYKGPSDVFHLMSIFSPIDRDLAVVYSPLMPVFFRNMLMDRGYQLIEVPDEEFESMGCNVLAMAPRHCLIVRGNPITVSRMQNAGCVVHEYEGQHMSVLGGGGPTCLTRPIIRG